MNDTEVTAAERCSTTIISRVEVIFWDNNLYSIRYTCDNKYTSHDMIFLRSSHSFDWIESVRLSNSMSCRAMAKWTAWLWNISIRERNSIACNKRKRREGTDSTSNIIQCIRMQASEIHKPIHIHCYYIIISNTTHYYCDYITSITHCLELSCEQ